MKRRIVGLAMLALAGLVGSSALASAPYARPGQSSRIVSATGAQPAYPAVNVGLCPEINAGGQDVSDDGRYVAFASDATNLVLGDTNQSCDVFRLDRVTHKIERVSVASDGAQGVDPRLNGSSEPSISADGRYVAFMSFAFNLVPGDTNDAQDIFIRDMKQRTTVRVSVSSSGAQGAGFSSTMPSISADGQHVAFMSGLQNLVSDDTNREWDIFVHDMRTRATSRVSVTPDGKNSNGSSFSPSLSSDGRYVAFTSLATNLVPGDTTAEACQCHAADVFWHDRKTGQNRRVSVASDGTQASFADLPSCTVGTNALANPPDPLPRIGGTTYDLCGSGNGLGRMISGDGRYVLFQSSATNLVPNDSNYNANPYSFGVDVFIHDVVTRRTERVSVNSLGQELPDGAYGGLLSATGRFGTFMAASEPTKCNTPDLSHPPSPDDLPGIIFYLEGAVLCGDQGSYVYDRRTGVADKVSATSSPRKTASCYTIQPAPSQELSFPGAVSRDGRYVAFMSSLANLAGGDTNKHCDWFVRDRGADVGVGAVLQSATGSGGAPSPDCGLPVCPPVPVGAVLQQARVTPRSGLRDLFIRWDVSQLAPVSGAPVGGLLYELRFNNAGQQYAVRAQRIPGPDFDTSGGASFGLFKQDATGLWTKVASLKGGYGTIGDSVVAAVPLSLLGGHAQLADVTAYTAVGTYLTGPTKVLDSLRLSR